MNIIEAIQSEIRRVNEIAEKYENPSSNAGVAFAVMSYSYAISIIESIEKAEKAIIEMDTQAMINALNELRKIGKEDSK